MRKTLEIYRSIAEQAADSIFITDMEGRVTYQNPEAQRTFGFTDQELLGHFIHDRIVHFHEDGLPIPNADCTVLRATTRGETVRDEVQVLLRKDGSRLYASCTSSPLQFEGERIGALFFATDITHRKMAEEALLQSTERLKIAVAAAQLGMFDYDPDTDTLNWSERTRELFGVAPDAPVSREVYLSRIHPDDRPFILKTFERIARPESGGHYQFEYRVLGNDGRVQRWLHAAGRMFYREGKPVRQTGIVMDITDRKESERRIREAAQHDSLTGLPNRTLLFEYCEHLLAQARRSGAECAVLFIDLDRFKPINDLYGHAVGDKVLQEVGRRLQAGTRKEDIVARLGGDEFVLVLPRIQSPFDPSTVAEHMLEEIARPIVVDGLELHVSPSIGISLFQRHGNDLATLIRQADLAMYAAKRSGRNTFRLYSSDHDAHISDRMRLEVRMKQALESQQLTLLYQPIIDIDSGQVTGAEALIRLAAEDGQLLTPDVFIPIAESAGLTERLGQWVANEACRQHRHWREAGLPVLSMAINVSAAQFRQRNFAAQLAEALQESGMDPSCLQVEITESTLMSNLSDTRATLQQLRAMGIMIALDDFGTGFSSLSSLSSLPLDKLKIDQSFIQHLESDPSNRSVTDTIIGMGHSLKLKVVGEGIESEEAMSYLRHHGCDQAQGYLFSKPVSGSEFESWYRTRPQPAMHS